MEVQDLPPDEDVVDGVPPDALGLYVRRGIDTKVELYQRNLERFAPDRDDLVEEIRVTLFHEVGHHLGLDEAGVGRLGLA